MGFWSTLVLTLFVHAFCAPCCGPCCMNVYFRMHLKDMLGVEDHCINDFCVALFCYPCAVGQQALAIDEYLGLHTECCCKLTSLRGSRTFSRPLKGHDHGHG